MGWSLTMTNNGVEMTTSPLKRFKLAARAHPVTASLMGIAGVGYVLGSYTFPTPSLFVFGGLESGHYWRLVTPIFLHFGLVHFLFNAIWLGMLGGRIEKHAGALHFFLLVTTIAVASNMGQYLWTHSVRFGGLSGVIYGLLGYLWMHHWLARDEVYALPRELLGFMLAWLVIGMTGALDVLLGVGIANAAHFVGLLTGMSLGLLIGFIASRQTDTKA